MNKQSSGTFYVYIPWLQIFSGHTHLEGLKLCFVAHGVRDIVTSIKYDKENMHLEGNIVLVTSVGSLEIDFWPLRP